jgi:hypothetical protein
MNVGPRFPRWCGARIMHNYELKDQATKWN